MVVKDLKYEKSSILSLLITVRHKVKELIELIQDDERLRTERKRAKKNRDKYVGVSSEEASYKKYSKYICHIYTEFPKGRYPYTWVVFGS